MGVFIVLLTANSPFLYRLTGFSRLRGSVNTQFVDRQQLFNFFTIHFCFMWDFLLLRKIWSKNNRFKIVSVNNINNISVPVVNFFSISNNSYIFLTINRYKGFWEFYADDATVRNSTNIDFHSLIQNIIILVDIVILVEGDYLLEMSLFLFERSVFISDTITNIF